MKIQNDYVTRLLKAYLIILDFLLQLSYSSSFVLQLLVKNADVHDDGRCNKLVTRTNELRTFFRLIYFTHADTMAQSYVQLFLTYFHVHTQVVNLYKLKCG